MYTLLLFLDPAPTICLLCNKQMCVGYLSYRRQFNGRFDYAAQKSKLEAWVRPCSLCAIVVAILLLFGALGWTFSKTTELYWGIDMYSAGSSYTGAAQGTSQLLVIEVDEHRNVVLPHPRSCTVYLDTYMSKKEMATQFPLDRAYAGYVTSTSGCEFSSIHSPTDTKTWHTRFRDWCTGWLLVLWMLAWESAAMSILYYQTDCSLRMSLSRSVPNVLLTPLLESGL